MQNHINKPLPPFKSVTSKPMLFFNIMLGLFGVFFLLFFPGGMIFLITNSFDETGLDENASVFLFLIFLFALVSFVSLIIYYRKKMYTTTIIDEKGIRYLNRFSGVIIKDLPWTSFAKKEKFEYVLESPKYDVNSNTPMKSLFDQFYWPVLIDGKIIIHNDAFLGKHFFVMLYSNRLELIRIFALGIAHYRPDITIDPNIFVNHYIDPNSYMINYRERRRIEIIGGSFCVLILVFLYFWIVY
jgi:ABC-type multidrug transport system fused ATPase/permease subunit